MVGHRRPRRRWPRHQCQWSSHCLTTSQYGPRWKLSNQLNETDSFARGSSGKSGLAGRTPDRMGSRSQSFWLWQKHSDSLCSWLQLHRNSKIFTSFINFSRFRCKKQCKHESFQHMPKSINILAPDSLQQQSPKIAVKTINSNLIFKQTKKYIWIKIDSP